MKRNEVDVYALIKRLLHLRDLLRNGAIDFSNIVKHMPGEYIDDASGKRLFRRDLHNLEALGYTIMRHQRPLRWSLEASTHLLSDDDVLALAHVRDAFNNNHPLTPTVHKVLEHLTSSLSEKQETIWYRQTVLRAPLNPAIDYSNCTELIQILERAISQRQQISFLYQARGKLEALLHDRLDAYEIEYADRHFYLIAFSYRYGSIISFRIDRIIQDAARESPRILPNMQQPRREPKPIFFTYRLPASFADGGISERFTICSYAADKEYVTIQASDTSEFRIVRILLGYGEHAQLLAGPPTLMECMRQTVKLMYANYQMDI